MASQENSSLRGSILQKIVRVKPRGLTPYERKVITTGESRFHSIPNSEKPKTTNISPNDQSVFKLQMDRSNQDVVGEKCVKNDADDAFPQHQNAVLASDPSTVPSGVPSDTQSLPPASKSNAYQEMTAHYLNSTEAYFHMLKTQGGIYIGGDCGRVLVVKEYEASRSRLHPAKYVLIQRQGRSFFHEECHWTYWCTCDKNVLQEISSLHSNVNMEYSDFCELYGDCLHIQMARMVFDRYDAENEIEPFDETLHGQDGDHRYSTLKRGSVMPRSITLASIFLELFPFDPFYCLDDIACSAEAIAMKFHPWTEYDKVSEELYTLPGTQQFILCRSNACQYGLINQSMDCISCRKGSRCDHSQVCKRLKHTLSESDFFDLLPNLQPDVKASAHTKASISFLKIPYERTDLLSARLKTLKDLGETLLPDLNECQSCGSFLQEGDPVKEGWLAYNGAIAVTNTSLKRVQVYYRPCVSCDAITIFEGSSQCLLNMGTYLVGYDVLRSYMYSFLHGRRPLFTFYQTFCDVHLDYGHTNIQADFPYPKFLRSWHAFLGMLDVDFSTGFVCPDCDGEDGKAPETVICDGTSLSFQRRMWQWSEEETNGPIKDLAKIKFCDRVFIADAGTRMLLKRFSVSGKALRGARLKPLDSIELRKLKTLVSEISKPLYNILNEIEGDPALFSVYQKFLFTLASPSAVSSLIRPVKSVEMLVNVILSGTNIKEEPVLWADLHRSMPIVFDIFEKHEVTDNMKLLLHELWNISTFTFVSATEDNSDHSVDFSLPHPDDELSFFPSLPKSSQRGKYVMDKTRSKDKETCCKKYAGHPSLLPGVFTMFCPHGVCYGFQVMQSNESPNIPFSILRTRFKKAPKHVIYDNACKLHEYCLNRDPLFFKETEFYVDRLHWDNHSSCGYGYELSSYPQFEQLNSQINEQANAGLKRVKDQLSYMTASHFMTHCAFYLRNLNMKKINKVVK